MNYSESLSFTFQDEEWLKKIGIGGLFALISFYGGLFFIFGFFLVGFYVGILRNVVKGEEKPLPSWSGMSKIFVDGLLGTIIVIIYLLAIGCMSAFAFTSIAQGSGLYGFEFGMACTLISILTIIAWTVFINYGLIQFATTDNFGAAFNLSGIFNMIKNHLGDFIAIAIFSFILNLILFFAGLGIISPFTNFWGMVIMAHLFGQLARRMQETTSEVQTA